jgi:serine protease Do
MLVTSKPVVAAAFLALALTTLGSASVPAPARAEDAATVPAPAVASPVSFAPLVKHVAPSVVNISATLKKYPDIESAHLADRPRDRGKMSLGSGFIIDPSGYVVTNNHVVADADTIKVITNDGAEHPAKLIGVDKKIDLALLKIEAGHPLPALEFGNSDEAEVGDWVIAVGNPFGLGGTVTAGIISGRERDLERGPFDNFLQIDAPLNRGNSGGPLFNAAGKVIGINAAIATPNGGSVGIGFAIPSAIARPVLTQLRASGKVTRGWIGVSLEKVTPAIADGLDLGKARGALVAEVVPDSPAAHAGIKQSDVVVRFDGKAIESMHELPVMIAESRAGNTVDVVVWRKGHELPLRVTMAALPGDTQKDENKDEEAKVSTLEAYGLVLATLDPDTRKRFGIAGEVRGVLISAMQDGDGNGLLPGDIIKKVDNDFMFTPQQVMRQFERGSHTGKKTVLIVVTRQGNDVIVGFTLLRG